ncbi:hypothetical protein OS189_09290 [Sulfitobacter sp. F26169L]|uniref:hypothetical protein n=1 Tax=Sulfitobacter sp. F26169L TaxID=2996015 RepID=UPI002260A50A|nr:hypothetical protein [Sulfitobacter sp. F26169L]MCX7566532.1 hypothetical protein [Sulfitobacter sp. F26169L]
MNKALFEKRYDAGTAAEYRIRSSNPRTLRLAIPGFVFFMLLAVGCFSAMAILQRHEIWFAAGFAIGIASAIGWMFFALTYGKRHFEQDATPRAKARSGIEKGNQT